MTAPHHLKLHHPDLFEKLARLRLMAAVVYDQGIAANLSDDEKEKTIEPIRHRHEELIKEAIQNDLPGLICAIKNYQALAVMDQNIAKRHQEKASEALSHADILSEHLKAHMLSTGKTQIMDGNYMAIITDMKLEIR